MKVKRYVVDSMPDALVRIRSDLGKNAVILNTKEIRTGGLWGWFGKKKIEVIAAADESPPPPLSSVSPSVHQAAVQAETAAAAAYSGRRPYSMSASEQTEGFPDTLKKGAPIVTDSGVRPAKEAADNSEGRDGPILEEIRQMKKLVQQLSTASVSEASAPPEWLELKERLLEQEVSPELVERILGPIRDEMHESAEEWDRARLVSSARDKMLEIFADQGAKAISEHTRIVHIVGPTGVGKTTSIAKLAAEQVLKHKRKVGLITSDTYRISAIEQLKTYATILNIPLEVVFSPQDMQRAFSQLEDRDIIFMDTAGRNYRNEMYVSELNSLLQSKGASETFLVLSLTTKYRDMKVIADNFMKFKLDKVLFTKMDETGTLGSILNLIDSLNLQLSYVTNGQNVPDDIAEASEQQIINVILGEAVHE
ncbi:flagellar biosynthesis protein FlhF [Paenibacillus sp. J2TS4]|uniref:flagellar biosynthesis protein FlhF n=1 Tax=Paenibacillus sp. J2TS4 TaxID=2807194 RepID=UPI001B2555A1|nr:flagellar biosynthesis protein FlhF [Paenibacillus sp. J2TS4]GIP33085.1 flagellar biosynthesis regulator FlhF [Paenibacillus sp. J2TS4]